MLATGELNTSDERLLRRAEAAELETSRLTHVLRVQAATIDALRAEVKRLVTFIARVAEVMG